VPSAHEHRVATATPSFGRTIGRAAARVFPCILGAALLADCTAPATLVAQETAFDRYIQAPDANYAWSLVRTVEGNPTTTYVIKLTSQSWLTPADVNRTVWEHWLIVVKPKQVASHTALLMVTGGGNGGSPPEKADAMIQRIAEATRTVVAELKMVPNQPLEFHQDGQPRKEDDLIAYGWAQFLDAGDPIWLARFPMVKSVVRAMDCLQEFTRSEQGGGDEVERFVVAGGSKRGWTTWMTGAADRRVAALVPIVIDVVNLDPSLEHHAAAYGFWATHIGDYVRHGVLRRWHEPRLQELFRHVDPYYYLDRLTMPKFVLNATGDQFFTPDSSRFYYDQLQGEKILRYVPNGDHSLRDTDAITSLLAYYQLIVTDTPRPRYEWTFESDGSIRVVTRDKPERVQVWRATNPDARDFRVMTLGRKFEAEDLEDQGDGVFVGRAQPPERGWTAFLVELTYHCGVAAPLKVSTAVRILPEKLPFEGIDPASAPYEVDVKPAPPGGSPAK